ncbi:MAG: EAL domain-containing protein [Methylomonas sp.]|nr:EAL domain-containing protein [Methylomonas sp.]
MEKPEKPSVLSCSIELPEIAYSTLSSEEQEKILHLQQAVLESMVHGGDHREVIDQVCLLEEQLLPNSIASVMLMDEAYEFLNVYAAPSVPAEGIAQLNGLRPGPGGGSCGNVIYQQKPQFVSNTFTDPRWQDLRQLAYNFNLCACWSLPIYSAQRKVVGTFALSSFEHRSPSPFHRKLLEIGASIIGIVLERTRSLESLRLFQKVFEGSQEGIMITDTNKVILSVNPGFTKILGYTEDELIGQTPIKFASGYHGRRFYEGMWHSIDTFGHWHGEIWNRRKNGEIFPEWLAISEVKDARGETTHYIGIFSDISERKDAEEQIRYLSSHDVLTGLPNRMLFEDRLNNAISFAERNHSKVALLNLDLDHFKMLNESLGHAAGDALLLRLTSRLKQCVREIDTLCRSGGDEFFIALAHLEDTDAISAIVDQILEQITEPFSLEGRSLSLSCSIGIAVYPDDGDDFDILMKRADKAMYQAKDSGRNTYRYFTEQLNSDSVEYMHITHELREAIKNNQFILHYQPQIDLTTGGVLGVEALVRWDHPVEGLMPPGRFIGIAEQNGLIVDIGQWVLHEACRQAVAWERAGLPPMVVAVNVSAVQFRRGNFEQVLRSALDGSGLAPRNLEIELTESTLFHDMDYMLTLLNDLKGLGVKLAIDDFGTGYSSLAYLKKFKIDRLKIDRSFVRDIASDPNDAAIVRAIVQMAHTLNLRVIAEGVEDRNMLEYLRSCHCDEVQGYYLAKPMSAAEIAEFIAK